MGLNYSLRLLFSNFSNVWKILLYKIFIMLCAIGLTTVISWHIISTLINEGFFVEVASTFETLLFNFNFEIIINSISSLVNNLIAILAGANLEIEAIVHLFLGIVIFYFLNGLFQLAITRHLTGYMSSLTGFGVFNSYISWFGKSLSYQLTRILISLPLDLIIAISAYYIMLGVLQLAGAFVAIFVTLCFVVLTGSLKYTVYCCWSTSIVVNNLNPFSAFKKNLKIVFKRFLRTWSSAIVLTLALILLNAFAISLTAGVGLIVILPMSTLILSIFNNVIYYTAMGMRFYVDNDTIITPKKLEEQDKFCRVKNII